MSSALIVVDMQPDFLPGGALAVEGGDAIVGPIRELLAADPFDLYVATQDWHPPGHVSFASSHPGHEPMEVIELYGHPQVLWPDHCVQGTPGAELHRDIPWDRVSTIIRKATDAATDSYSAFRNNWNRRGQRPPTGLTGYLRDRGVTDVFLCGLARDYCVKWSAEDAVAAGFRTTVLWDLTRSVDASGDAQVEHDLNQVGAKLVDSTTVVPA